MLTDKEKLSGPPFWKSGVELTTLPHKKKKQKPAREISKHCKTFPLDICEF